MNRLVQFILTACLLWAGTLPAQDLHLYVDVFTDSVYFMRDGKPVAKPEVKRGHQVVVHLMNYNNYLYEANMDVEDETILMADRNGGGMASAGGGGSNSSPLSMLFGGAGFPKLPFLDGLEEGGMGFASSSEMKARKAQSERIAQLDKIISNTLRDMTTTENELQELENQAKEVLATVKLEQFAFNEIQRIRYDPNLEPTKIKALAMEYAQKIFGETDPDKITLQLILDRPKTGEVLGNIATEYKTTVSRYNSYLMKVDDVKKELKGFSFPETTLPDYIIAIDQASVKGNARLGIFESNRDTLMTRAAGMDAMGTDKLSELRTVYTVLMQNEFSKTYRHEAQGELMTFKISLKALESVKDNGAHDKKIPPITVKSYGGMKVNTSVGLGFAQYFKRPQQFFVRDSVVSASNKDAFVPTLSSFVHFYYQRPAMVSWGGSFGAGMPLTGGDGLQSITFFLGPSMIIGQGSRIVISTGLMGGRVSKPAQGYKPGDHFPSDAALFTTESAYELGYFLSATFNLLGK
jgi:hypothetical protein